MTLLGLEVFTSHAKEIVSIATPFVLWFINNRFQPRAKLIQQTRHGFTLLIPNPLLDAQGNQVAPTQTVNTASVSIFNAGRSPATKVEIVLSHSMWSVLPAGRDSFSTLPAVKRAVSRRTICGLMGSNPFCRGKRLGREAVN
jgi:hypothetical protein